MQLQARNIVPNGLFLQTAQNWNMEGTVSFPQGDNNKPVLTWSDWDATVSQMIPLPVHTGYTEYRLRVRAKGQGTISIITPGNTKYMLFFNQSTFTTQELYFYPDASTTQVDLIIQSERIEFTVDWVEIQEMKVTEEPLGANGQQAAYTVGMTKPVGHPEVLMTASTPSTGLQPSNRSNCNCVQSGANSNSDCNCS
ncbi:hypothetical protein [Bacillus thuringiensis]|uniref:hypothetical protein n=1 Tax=Bacillus thuringiensis TaxID=1428 RepID=UPI000BFCD10B|nr:hypothetical protein [Bacillus thuringiensis]PGW35222.1 hypothetical protein COE03_29750 [Bacillus thuringiensis]